MINKSLLQKGASHLFLIAISILVLIMMLGITLWKNTPTPTPTSSETAHTLELSGIVTKKVTSCGVKSLTEDGTIKVSPGICDAGESLMVGGKSVATSSGGPQVDGFSINIDSINPGDEVLIHYILNEMGSPTLDCKSCSVVRTKHINRAESF